MIMGVRRSAVAIAAYHVADLSNAFGLYTINLDSQFYTASYHQSGKWYDRTTSSMIYVTPI